MNSSKKNNKKRLKDEHVHYVATVSNWNHIYGLSPGMRNKYETDPYSEFSVLSFAGEIVRPERGKYPKAEIEFSSRRGMFDEVRDTATKFVGLLSTDDEVLRAYVFVPEERMAELLTLASTNRVEAIAFTGTKLKWRKGSVINIQTMTNFIEEEW